MDRVSPSDALRASWTPLERLSLGPATGSPGGTHPVLFEGETVHVVWERAGDIQYRRSRDGGLTWENPATLTRSGTEKYPCSLEVAGSGIHLLWPDSRHDGWEVFHKQSTDGGDSWGEETRLAPGVDLFRMATAACESTLHVAWASKSLIVPTPAGTHTWGEIYYQRSTDAGRTWEPVQQLTAEPGAGMRPGLAAAGDDVHLVWYERRGDSELLDWPIHIRRSRDGGATWHAAIELRSAPTRFPHHPQIVAGEHGRVCAIWEEGQTFDGAQWSGDPALHARVSDDGGDTWSDCQRLTFINAPDGWATHAKSHACGSRIDLAWTDAPEGRDGPRAAYYMASTDGGGHWGPPERLTSAADGNCQAEAVGGGSSAAMVVIARAGELYYRRGPA